MATLIIGVPWNHMDKNGKPSGHDGQPNSWQNYYDEGKARGYELFPNQVSALLKESSKVVILRNDKDHLKRAEAHLVDLKPTETLTKRAKRYDIYFDQQKKQTYSYPSCERLAWNSVRVIY